LAKDDDFEERDFHVILDYYTKSALSHSGYILVCFFGIFSLLTLMVRFFEINDPLMFFATHWIFVTAYALVVFFGMYETRRWKFYSSRAKCLANFVKVELAKNAKFRGFVSSRIPKERESTDFLTNLLKNEWLAVGRNGTGKGSIPKLFDYSEQFFFMFCTGILIGSFGGAYFFSSLDKAYVLLWLLFITVYYGGISLIAWGELKEIAGGIEPEYCPED
jgi:hypothetical protein